ncbi:MAG TPA: hypothetical protein VNO50_19870 [Pyrinomonadaceae bacterium]|nr:hypothetical protein [Pyrinomonadaceae bacterium]
MDKRRLVQGLVVLGVVAVLLVLVGLKLVGLAPAVAVALVGTGVLVALGVRGWQRRQMEVILDFYVSANEILGDEAPRRRYHFEIAEAIKSGEKVVSSMPDPPPLSSFALGALYHSIGNQNGAVQHLALAAEDELLKESPHIPPSRKLRRYVRRVRQIERRPERWPKINAAIRNLERLHHERAALLLAQNQNQLTTIVAAYEVEKPRQLETAPTGARIPSNRSLRSVKSPPPISEVLNDIYQEENKATN